MKWDEVTTRERDAWVAEEVMGWSSTGYDDDVTYEDWFGFQNGDASDPNSYVPVPHYTTDLNATWLVVKQMGDCLHLKEHGEEGTWAAMFCGMQMEWHSGDTASEAICLAALRVVGVDI